MPELLSAAAFDEIQSLIGTGLEGSGAPGAAVGIVRDGEVIAFFGSGTSSLETGDAPTPESMARVASVTKTFTATAIMQLRDASLLTLDDPLLIHLPEFTVAQAVGAPLEGVTIRRMLTHHSGLSTEHPDLDWNGPDFPILDHVLGSLEKVQVVIPQDSQWKYSNLAYCLLGEVVSRLSGRPYLEYVHDEIIGPLGLKNTVFDLSSQHRELMMTGYSPPAPGEASPRVAPYGHLKGFSAAGQLQSNVEDLAKWIDFHLGGGTDGILDLRSRQEMRRPVYVADDWSSGQGIGWRAVRKGENVFWNHGGAVHGFSTSVIFHAPSRIGVIALLNMWPAVGSPDLALRIAEIAIGNATAERRPASRNKQDETLSEYPVPSEFAGEYWAEPGLPVHILATDAGLEFTRPAAGEATLHAPATLEPAGEDTFRVLNGRAAGELAEFQRSGDGKVSGFTLGGFLYRKIN